MSEFFFLFGSIPSINPSVPHILLNILGQSRLQHSSETPRSFWLAFFSLLQSREPSFLKMQRADKARRQNVMKTWRHAPNQAVDVTGPGCEFVKMLGKRSLSEMLRLRQGDLRERKMEEIFQRKHQDVCLCCFMHDAQWSKILSGYTEFLEVLQSKFCFFFAIHWNPSLAYIAVRDL